MYAHIQTSTQHTKSRHHTYDVVNFTAEKVFTSNSQTNSPIISCLLFPSIAIIWSLHTHTHSSHFNFYHTKWCQLSAYKFRENVLVLQQCWLGNPDVMVHHSIPVTYFGRSYEKTGGRLTKNPRNFPRNSQVRSQVRNSGFPKFS